MTEGHDCYQSPGSQTADWDEGDDDLTYSRGGFDKGDGDYTGSVTYTRTGSRKGAKDRNADGSGRHMAKAKKREKERYCCVACLLGLNPNHVSEETFKFKQLQV